jgi:pilus assembly protein CpaC
VRDQGRSLLLTGTKLGYTSLVTAKGIYKVAVVNVDSARAYEKLKNLFKNFKGLKLGADSKGVRITGELLRFSDWELIAETAKAEDFPYAFAARVPADLAGRAQAHFRKLLSQAELPPVHISLSENAKAVLPAEFAPRRSQYQAVLAPYGIEIDKDDSLVALAPMVEVEILAAEVERNYLRSFGVRWPTEASLSADPQTGTLRVDTLEAALRAMESRGAGRILASPKLLCRSGKEAEFLAGGEIPLVIRQKYGSHITWKKHGVILKVKPLADLSGRMSIDLETEVSLPDMKNKILDLPSFKTNRIKSHFDLEGTRTIALSGLLKTVESHGHQGLPLLSDLPILGALFSSRDYQEERTELVFFVTPRLVPFDTPSVEKKLPEWEK